MNKEFHNLFPQGSPNTVAGQYFSGASYLCPLSDMGVSVSNVTFEPSCRNNWHIHHNGGQILLCTAGRGYYQEWGKSAQELNPGDVVNIPDVYKRQLLCFAGCAVLGQTETTSSGESHSAESTASLDAADFQQESAGFAPKDQMTEPFTVSTPIQEVIDDPIFCLLYTSRCV